MSPQNRRFAPNVVFGTVVVTSEQKRWLWSRFDADLLGCWRRVHFRTLVASGDKFGADVCSLAHALADGRGGAPSASTVSAL